MSSKKKGTDGNQSSLQMSPSSHGLGENVEQVVDRAVLLIIRELSLNNKHFQGLQAQTGLSSHLLARRLKQLERDGLVERRLYCVRPKRYEYLRTKKGQELDELLFRAASWDLAWGASDEASLTFIDKRSGKQLLPEVDVARAKPEEDTDDNA